MGKQLSYGADDPIAVPAQREVPLTGASISPRSSALVIVPAGTIAALTILLPANPLDGQRLVYVSTAVVTALTVTAAAGDSVVGALTALAVNVPQALVYVKAVNTWYVTT